MTPPTPPLICAPDFRPYISNTDNIFKDRLLSNMARHTSTCRFLINRFLIKKNVCCRMPRILGGVIVVHSEKQPTANLSSTTIKCCCGGTGFDAYYKLSFSFKRKLLWNSEFTLSAQCSEYSGKEESSLSFISLRLVGN